MLKKILQNFFLKERSDEIIRLVMAYKGEPVNLAIGVSNVYKKFKKTIVCIEEKGRIYKVISAKAGSDGSINILFPYCKEKKAYIYQHTHIYKPGFQRLELRQIKKEYIVDIDSKVSVHKSGFVQLSGEGILSGFNKYTGKPRGIGIFTNPLKFPIASGPTIGFQCWGIENGFQELKNRKKDVQYIILKKDDFYNRNDYNKDANSYTLELWIFPKQANNFVYEYGQEPYIDHIIGNYVPLPGAKFTHPVMDIKGFNSVLAVFPITNWCQYADESEHGYILGSPGGSNNRYLPIRNKVYHCFRIICPRKDGWPQKTLNPPSLHYSE
ncbi:MAG: hypothetical protein WCV92_02340 [Candidatus Buchananbacteria bacterium]